MLLRLDQRVCATGIGIVCAAFRVLRDVFLGFPTCVSPKWSQLYQDLKRGGRTKQSPPPQPPPPHSLRSRRRAAGPGPWLRNQPPPPFPWGLRRTLVRGGHTGGKGHTKGQGRVADMNGACAFKGGS